MQRLKRHRGVGMKRLPLHLQNASLRAQSAGQDSNPIMPAADDIARGVSEALRADQGQLIRNQTRIEESLSGMHDAQGEAFGRQRDAVTTEMNHMKSEMGESNRTSYPIDSNQAAWRASGHAVIRMPNVPV